MNESSSEGRALLPTPVWAVLNTRRGKTTVVLFAAGVLLVLLTAAAAACIPWEGEMEAEPVDADGNSLVGVDGREATAVHGGHGEVVDGETRSGMVWCKGGDEPQPYSSAKAYPTDHVEISAAVSGCDTQLPDGDYTITFADGSAFLDDELSDSFEDDEWYLDCMDTGGTDVDYRWSERLTVNDGSGGPVRIDLSEANPVETSGDFEASALCLTEENPSEDDIERGNQLPISILG